MSKKANLRVCMSCEWIFTRSEAHPESGGCPKDGCFMGHYGARYVYGDRAYRYAKTQEPWYRRKMAQYSEQLTKEINAPKPSSACSFAPN